MASHAAEQSSNWWKLTPTAPSDAVFGVVSAYDADPAQDKVNLVVGAFRTEEGHPWILPIVKKAERLIVENTSLNHEYLPIDGLPQLNAAAAQLLLGPNSTAIKEQRVCTVQSLSGTGALRLGAEFIRRFHDTNVVYIPHPTWSNHSNIFKDAGLTVKEYRYYDPSTNAVDEKGLLESLDMMPARSVVLLHACAHNPTGADPSSQQWETIAEICEKRRLLVFLDSAYQGFASGDADRDAASIRYFVDTKKMNVVVAQSFAKNFGLYNERVGALTFTCETAQQAIAVRSQLKALARPMYSNPPAFGARIVAQILNDPQAKAEWQECLKIMAGRIFKMRKLLYDRLIALKTPGSFKHIVDQIGMFSYIGLSNEQVHAMIHDHHVYVLGGGRINMSGINSSNVAKVANAIHDVVVRFPANH